MPLFRYRVSNKKIRTQTNVCLVVLSNGVSHWVCPFVCCLLPQTSRQSLATHSSSATFMTTCILVVTFFPATIISVVSLPSHMNHSNFFPSTIIFMVILSLSTKLLLVSLWIWKQRTLFCLPWNFSRADGHSTFRIFLFFYILWFFFLI